MIPKFRINPITCNSKEFAELDSEIPRTPPLCHERAYFNGVLMARVSVQRHEYQLSQTPPDDLTHSYLSGYVDAMRAIDRKETTRFVPRPVKTEGDQK